MPQVEKLLVFLASPGDVPTERRYVQEIVADLNRTVASDDGVVLQVVRWENDTFPGYGQDAQALINAQIAEMSRYTLFVGIMWNRLGTPTSRASSGTVEEFERAVQAFKQNGQPNIWFYFRQSASMLDTEDQLEQRKKVLAFKKEVQANGMPGTYKNPSDFRDKFRNQVTLWLNARTRTMSEQDRQRPQEEDARRKRDEESRRRIEEERNRAEHEAEQGRIETEALLREEERLREQERQRTEEKAREKTEEEERRRLEAEARSREARDRKTHRAASSKPLANLWPGGCSRGCSAGYFQRSVLVAEIARSPHQGSPSSEGADQGKRRRLSRRRKRSWCQLPRRNLKRRRISLRRAYLNHYTLRNGGNSYRSNRQALRNG